MIVGIVIVGIVIVTRMATMTAAALVGHEAHIEGVSGRWEHGNPPQERMATMTAEALGEGPP